MSQTANLRHIHCDGPECGRIAGVSIALRSQLKVPQDVPPADGWLFVTGTGPCRHYCPDCAQRVLRGRDIPATKL